MCLFLLCQTLISLLSLGTKLVTEHRKERFSIHDIFPVKNGIREVVLRCGQTMLLKSIHMRSLNYSNFDCLCCCFKWWKSTRDCQIGDSRATRSGGYFVPHPFSGTDKKLSSRKFSFILQKNKMSSMVPSLWKH